MTTFYVNKSGNDSNDGLAPATAKLTIQAGITAAGAGTHTVIVQTGVYHESLFQSATQTITFLADGKVVLDGRGILQYGANLNQVTVTFIFNRLTDKGGWTIRGYYGAGLRNFAINTTPIIGVHNTVIEDCAAGYSGSVSGAAVLNADITGCLIKNCGVAISFGAVGGSLVVTNNTIVRCPIGVSISTSPGTFTVRNNIIARAGIPSMVMLSYGGAGLSSIVSNFNTLYFDGVSTVTSSGTHTTLAAYQAASSKDAQSVSADPLFIDPAKELWGITVGSPSFNAGGSAANGVPKAQGFSGLGSSSQREILGVSSVANASLWTGGVFVNTQIDGNGRIVLVNPGTPTGTFATDVRDFGFNRRVRRVSLQGLLNWPESVIDFDTGDVQPNRAKIEVRHSLTAFAKTDVSPAWVTIEDGDDLQAVLGVSLIRYLQIRFTLRVDGVAA